MGRRDEDEPDDSVEDALECGLRGGLERRQEHGVGRSPYTPAIGAGALLWLLAATVGSGREAWQSGVYWILAYPPSVAAAGFLGYRHPQRAWRWGLAVILAQAAIHAISALGRGFLPVGSTLFVLLALPAAGVAMLAARFRLETDAKLR